MISESAVEDRIRLRAPQLGGVLWRNNVGALPGADGRPIRFGLCNDSQRVNRNIKSSDLVGIMPLVIRPEHVGRRFGLFVACEVKAEGWHYHANDKHENAQLRFIQLVNAHGGRGCFAQSAEDFERAWSTV